MKKSLSLILAMILILACAPLSALAAGPKSITKIEVNSAPSPVEGTGGRLVGTYNAETGEYTGAYFEYDLDPITVHLYFADGTDKIVQNQAECRDATGYYWDLTSDQSADNPWDLGYHTATVTIGPKSTNYLITVRPSTIKGITASNVTLIEGIDGWDDYVYNQSTGNFDSYFKYSYYSAITVTRGDGTTETVYSGYADYDTYGDVFFCDDQSATSPWGVGDHEVTAYLLGRECKFTVTIIPNPVKSVVFHDITLYGGINDYEVGGKKMYFYYFDFTVTFKDGTTQRSEEGRVEYGGRYYYAHGNDNQYNEPWGYGDHYVAADIGGVGGTQKVTVTADPYCMMTIFEDGDMELYVRLWKNSYIYDEYLVTNFIFSEEDEYGWLVSQITFNRQPHMVKFHISHDPSGIPYYEQDMRMTLGELTSDNHFDILWLKKQMLLNRYAGYTFVQPYFDPAFNGFTRTAYDIDDVVQLACNIRGCFDKYQETGWDDEGAYVYLETRVVIEAVQYVFGLDISEEIENYKYWPADPDWQFQVRVNKSSMTDYVKDLGFDPAPDVTGQRYMTTTYGRPDGTEEQIRFRMDEDLTINAIFFLGQAPQYDVGDVDGDGSVNMKDVLFLRKVIAGAETLTEEQAKRADVNGDGEVNMKDVLALRKIIAGAA